MVWDPETDASVWEDKNERATEPDLEASREICQAEQRRQSNTDIVFTGQPKARGTEIVWYI